MAAPITPEAVAKAHERFPNLETVVARRLWPTPRANEGSQRNSRDNGMALSRAVKLWPTPAAARVTWRTDTQLSGDGRDTPNKLGWAAMDRTGQAEDGNSPTPLLSPLFVEWLMGFPAGWAALEPSEMPSSRKPRRSSGKPSETLKSAAD